MVEVSNGRGGEFSPRANDTPNNPTPDNFGAIAGLRKSTSIVRKKTANKTRKNAEEEAGTANTVAKSFFGLCHFQEHLKNQDYSTDDFGGKGCPVCKAQIYEGDKFVNRKSRKIQYFTSPLQMDFHEFVKKLIPDVNNAKEKLIKGCSIIMPETVFFRDGKIDLILQNDREYCLYQDTKTKTSDNLEIRKKLPDFVEQRRKCKEYRELFAVHKMAAGLIKGPEGKLNKDNAPRDSKDKDEEKHVPYGIIKFNNDATEGDMAESGAVPGHHVVSR